MKKTGKRYCPYCGRPQKTGIVDRIRGKKVCTHCEIPYNIEDLEADTPAPTKKKRKNGKKLCIFCGEPQKITIKDRFARKCTCANCGNIFEI